MILPADMRSHFIEVPRIVRMKPGALSRMGVYLARPNLRRIFLVQSHGLVRDFADALRKSAANAGVDLLGQCEVTEASVEAAVQLLGALPQGTQAIVGLGGGKALDIGKYLAALSGLSYFAVPTSLSNDGFCSPQSSLTLGGRRKSFPTGLPNAVIVDTEVCLGAPVPLWCSGVGDLVSKLTAVRDWKLAFHARGTPVNDLAALMSDASVYQFIARPMRDSESIRLLAIALMLNGVAMEIAGSSRPASGSEHLISHALDHITTRPALHGIQVGVATYIVSRLQQNQSDLIARLFQQTGFWEVVRQNPFSKREWLEAVRQAPSIKDDFYTILSEHDQTGAVKKIIEEDSNLCGCFAE
jgi:glycerol-1-phosphate dehydrogenase [NAD(P)+]